MLGAWIVGILLCIKLYRVFRRFTVVKWEYTRDRWGYENKVPGSEKEVLIQLPLLAYIGYGLAALIPIVNIVLPIVLAIVGGISLFEAYSDEYKYHPTKLEQKIAKIWRALTKPY